MAARKPAKGKKKKGPGPPTALLVFLLGLVTGVLGYVLLKDRIRPPAGAVVPMAEKTPVPEPTRPAKPRATVGPRATVAPRATPAVPHPTATPRKAEPPRKPETVAAAPSADFEPAEKPGTGALAILLDDLGFDEKALVRLAAWKGPLALAIIPHAPRAQAAADLARRKGWDVMIHLPMLPAAGKPERDAIGPGDSDAVIVERFRVALDLVPGAIGLNNHQGSLATTDQRVMRALLRAVKASGLFFLDSRTTAESVGEREARALGIPTVSRDVFLDHAGEEMGISNGPRAVLESSWQKAHEVIAKKGTCVVIGHPHAETLDFLEKALPGLAADGIRRVKVSELVN